MKQPLSFVAGLITGALAMYYLDARSGPRRRAMARDKMLSAGHDLSHLAEAKGKRAFGRLKGMLATRRLDRVSRSMPHSDQQLRDRIRSRLGRVVAYPKAVELEVDQGRVHLHGHVLRHEADQLCRAVWNTAGVRELHHQLQVHRKPEEIAQLYSHVPSGQQERHPAAEPAH